MKKGRLAALILSIALLPRVSWADDDLPNQVRDLRLGMSRAEFLSARPKIAQRYARDLKRANRQNGIFRERFSEGDFDSAIYVFQNEKLAAMTLYLDDESKGAIRARRQKVYKNSVAKLGAPTKMRGKMRAGRESVIEDASAATWNKAGKRAMLLVPGGKRKRSPKLMLTILAPETKEQPNFEEVAASDSEKKAAFSEAGFQD